MKYKKLLLITLLSTVFIDLLRLISWVKEFDFFGDSSTYLSASLSYISIFIYIYIFFKNKLIFKNIIPRDISLITRFWVLLLIINLFRGIVLADDYWGLKYLFLSSIPFTFIFFIYYIGLN